MAVGKGGETNIRPQQHFAGKRPKIMFYFKLNSIKKFNWTIFGQLASMGLTKMAFPHGALNTLDDDFFHKIYPLWI